MLFHCFEHAQDKGEASKTHETGIKFLSSKAQSGGAVGDGMTLIHAKKCDIPLMQKVVAASWRDVAFPGPF